MSKKIVIFYITSKNSETGKKFNSVIEKIQECKKACKVFMEKYGFTEYREASTFAIGGISSCGGFKTIPDKKIWRKGPSDGEFIPRSATEEGRVICNEIMNLPKVTYDEINNCIGYNLDNFNCIGFNFSNKEYTGFSIMSDWGVKIPSDCEEITYSRYKELFKS